MKYGYPMSLPTQTSTYQEFVTLLRSEFKTHLPSLLTPVGSQDRKLQLY